MVTQSNPRRPIRFCTLAGVEEATLVGKDTIRGRWWNYVARSTIHEVGKRGRNTGLIEAKSSLLEEFANWPDTPEMILRFTLKYGTLNRQSSSGKDFLFRIDEWRSSQREFRHEWEQLLPKKGRILPPIFMHPVQTEEGEQLIFNVSELYYQTSSLYRLLRFELYAISKNGIRKCGKPDCENPYFIAHHGLQRYCSDLCSDWAQKQQKLNWWNQEGRKERIKSRARIKVSG